LIKYQIQRYNQKANWTSPMTIYKKRKQVLLLVVGAAPDESAKPFL
jgi:hypothetical protein